MQDIRTMREEMATQLLAALLSNPAGPIQQRADTGWGFVNCTMEDMASMAVWAADALLSALREGEA